MGALQHFAVASTSNLLMGTQENAAKSIESVVIYPNPSKDVISIKFPGMKVKDLSFEITDLSGRSLLKKDNESEINISELANGAYIGIIKAGDQKAVRKVLINR